MSLKQLPSIEKKAEEIDARREAYEKLPEWFQYAAWDPDKRPKIDWKKFQLIDMLTQIGGGSAYAASQAPPGHRGKEFWKRELQSGGLNMLYGTLFGLGIMRHGLRNAKIRGKLDPLPSISVRVPSGDGTFTPTNYEIPVPDSLRRFIGSRKNESKAILRGLALGYPLGQLTANAHTSHLFNESYKDFKLPVFFPNVTGKSTNQGSVLGSSLVPYTGSSRAGLKIYRHLLDEGYDRRTAMTAAKQVSDRSSTLGNILGFGSILPFQVAGLMRGRKMPGVPRKLWKSLDVKKKPLKSFVSAWPEVDKLKTTKALDMIPVPLIGAHPWTSTKTLAKATGMGMLGQGLGSLGSIGRAERIADEIKRENSIPAKIDRAWDSFKDKVGL